MEDLSNKVANGGATADGILASTEWNQVPSELQNIITSTGQTLSAGNLEQVGDGVAAMTQGQSYWGVDTGSSTAYVVNTLNSTLRGPSRFTGMHIKFRPANDNTTTTPTLNVNGFGANTIVREDGSALVVGDMANTRDCEVRWNGSNWLLLDRSRGLIIGNLYAKGHIYGMLTENASTDTQHDINIAQGECASSDGTFNLVLSATMRKRIDSLWTAGSGGGGMGPAAGVQANTWYRVFVIGGSGATTDAGFDTSVTASNLLSRATSVSGNTYNKYRQVAWVRTDGSSNVYQYLQSESDPNVFTWTHDMPLEDTLTLSTGVNQTFDIDYAPSRSQAIMAHSTRYTSSNNTFDFYVHVGSPATVNTLPVTASTMTYFFRSSGQGSGQVIINIDTGTHNQCVVGYTSSSGSVTHYASTLGFIYNRGSYTDL